jgi:hypothetical protein
MRDYERFEVTVTFDERRGYVAIAPEWQAELDHPFTSCLVPDREALAPTTKLDANTLANRGYYK